METHKRSLAKAMSWRFFAVLITSTIAWFLTGSFDLALKIGIVDTLIKLGAYYAHERAWIKIPFGKVEPVAPEYQI